MNKSIVKKVLVFLVPLVAVFLLCILAVYVANNISLPPCITYTLFHINCPGCGMTRSVIALLHFDFLLSLRQNAFIIVGIVLALMYYIEAPTMPNLMLSSWSGSPMRKPPLWSSENGPRSASRISSQNAPMPLSCLVLAFMASLSCG